MMSLENRKIVVVGGSSGMGLATAANLARAGAQVVIASRSLEKLERAQQVIARPVERRVLDVRSEPEVAEFFRSLGVFDHLVITASEAVLGPFLELGIGAAQEYFDSKFWGAYRVARYAAPHMVKDGSITFFSGAASQRGTAGLAAGSAINAAIEALGRTLALELAPIRVNTVAPGLIETPVWGDIMGDEQRQAFFTEAAAKLPLKRIGTAEEVAHAVRYLIENTYTTGTVLFPEGGYLQV
jgi:NAD(P)-dependent dehydrogenase (short-subunit alcohol dehydrogenase family)